jgi:hypothetical protein
METKNNTKWLILIKLRHGFLTKSIVEELRSTKTNVLRHVKDLRKAGLVNEFTKGRFTPTPKGYRISPEDFIKLVYRGGGHGVAISPQETTNELLRYHNLSFSVDILEKPQEIKQDFRTIQLKNNVFYIKSYLNGSVKFHNHKAVLCLSNVYGAEVEEIALKSLEVLENLKKEVLEDGFKLDSLYVCNSQHIADPFNKMAQFIGQKFGACVLVKGEEGGERLTIDFSKGLAEIETENKYEACEDMEKVQTFYTGLLSLSKREIREKFS